MEKSQVQKKEERSALEIEEAIKNLSSKKRPSSHYDDVKKLWDNLRLQERIITKAFLKQEIENRITYDQLISWGAMIISILTLGGSLFSTIATLSENAKISIVSIEIIITLACAVVLGFAIVWTLCRKKSDYYAELLALFEEFEIMKICT